MTILPFSFSPFLYSFSPKTLYLIHNLFSLVSSLSSSPRSRRWPTAGASVCGARAGQAAAHLCAGTTARDLWQRIRAHGTTARERSASVRMRTVQLLTAARGPALATSSARGVAPNSLSWIRRWRSRRWGSLRRSSSLGSVDSGARFAPRSGANGGRAKPPFLGSSSHSRIARGSSTGFVPGATAFCSVWQGPGRSRSWSCSRSPAKQALRKGYVFDKELVRELSHNKTSLFQPLSSFPLRRSFPWRSKITALTNLPLLTTTLGASRRCLAI
jgi:hypothetical protein